MRHWAPQKNHSWNERRKNIVGKLYKKVSVFAIGWQRVVGERELFFMDGKLIIPHFWTPSDSIIPWHEQKYNQYASIIQSNRNQVIRTNWQSTYLEGRHYIFQRMLTLINMVVHLALLIKEWLDRIKNRNKKPINKPSVSNIIWMILIRALIRLIVKGMSINIV